MSSLMFAKLKESTPGPIESVWCPGEVRCPVGHFSCRFTGTWTMLSLPGVSSVVGKVWILWVPA